MASSSKVEDNAPMEVYCQYPNRKCHQSVIPSYNYCLRHILEDKNAPYRACSFTYPNSNKKCPLAAPKGDKRDTGYCQMHLFKLLLKRQKSSAKNVPPMTTESLLSELSHYVRPVRSTWNKNSSSEKQDPNVTTALNPFVEVDVSKAWLRRVQVLECASESDSDGEPATLDNVCRALQEESSDAESIDSQMEEPLRFSGIYTAEEAVLLARNKMMRLQLLYQKQFDKILTTLKEKKRNYLLALKKEKETLCSLNDQTKYSAKDKKLYEKLKALHRYHRKSNRETIAYLSSQEKRSKQNGIVKPVGSKCTYTEGGVRCCGPTLPLTKFCFKHILQDPNQCIFRPCGCVKADSLCQEPVVELTGDETCLLHYKLPSLPHLPSMSNDEYSTHEKSMEGESELDASATESAISTDNGISNEEAMVLDHIKKESKQCYDSGMESHLDDYTVSGANLPMEHKINRRMSSVSDIVKQEMPSLNHPMKSDPSFLPDELHESDHFPPSMKMEFAPTKYEPSDIEESVVQEDHYVILEN